MEMDIFQISVVCTFVLTFGILTYAAKKGFKINTENIIMLLITTLLFFVAMFMSIGSLYYAVSGQLPLGLTQEYLRISIFVGGITIVVLTIYSYWKFLKS